VIEIRMLLSQPQPCLEPDSNAFPTGWGALPDEDLVLVEETNTHGKEGIVECKLARKVLVQ
jgi:hypothetical protein